MFKKIEIIYVSSNTEMMKSCQIHRDEHKAAIRKIHAVYYLFIGIAISQCSKWEGD